MNATQRAQLADCLSTHESFRHDIEDCLSCRRGNSTANDQTLLVPQVPRQANGGATYTFITLPIQVSFSTNPVVTPQLPLRLDPTMFHIHMPLGRPGAARGESVAVKAGCDSLSAGNFGQLEFLLDLLRRYPRILKEVNLSKQGIFRDILLGGIVQDSDPSSESARNAHITKVSVLFTFYTPLTTSDGDPVYFQVGAGKDIAVNLIIGNPWLKKTRASMHFETPPTLRVQGLNVTSFPGHFMCPQCSQPSSGSVST